MKFEVGDCVEYIGTNYPVLNLITGSVYQISCIDYTFIPERVYIIRDGIISADVFVSPDLLRHNGPLFFYNPLLALVKPSTKTINIIESVINRYEFIDDPTKWYEYRECTQGIEMRTYLDGDSWSRISSEKDLNCMDRYHSPSSYNKIAPYTSRPEVPNTQSVGPRKCDCSFELIWREGCSCGGI